MRNTLMILLIPFLGTALGSAFVFFMRKEMPALAVTIHNFPEGMAVGVGLAGAMISGAN